MRWRKFLNIANFISIISNRRISNKFYGIQSFFLSKKDIFTLVQYEFLMEFYSFLFLFSSPCFFLVPGAIFFVYHSMIFSFSSLLPFHPVFFHLWLFFIILGMWVCTSIYYFFPQDSKLNSWSFIFFTFSLQKKIHSKVFKAFVEIRVPSTVF